MFAVFAPFQEVFTDGSNKSFAVENTFGHKLNVLPQKKTDNVGDDAYFSSLEATGPSSLMQPGKVPNIPENEKLPS